MIEISLLIAYAVFFIHVTTWEGHIWEDVANWLDIRLPEWISKPLYGCPICMSFWWGMLIMATAHLYGFINYHGLQALIIIFAAGGINVVNAILSKWYQKLIREEDEWEQNVGQSTDN